MEGWGDGGGLGRRREVGGEGEGLLFVHVLPLSLVISSSSSSLSDGNSSLLNEGGSTSQVPQATVELAGYGSVVWPDSLSEWLVDRAGLQQMFCCLLPVLQGHCSVWPMWSLEYR